MLNVIFKSRLQNISSWLFVIAISIGVFALFIFPHASATTSGKMTLYFHKEASDINETYNAFSFTPPEPAADTAPGTLTSTTNVNATPPTSFCESGDGQTDVQNERAASAASTGNRCLGTFISSPIGNAISIATGDGATAITSQLWSSESATQAAVALNVYIYRCTTTCISTTTLTSSDRIATLTCAEPGTTATTCTASSAPANNITFNTTDRIVAVVSSNVTVLRAGADTRFYFDSTGRTATSVTLSYTAAAYNTSNKPTLTGSLDDDFTNYSVATSACSTSGTAISKWTCLQGSAANTAGAVNAADSSGNGGASSGWLWISNQATSTAATTSNFGTTPSNTFLYQTMPTSYADGTIRTVVNSSATFGVGATNATSPFNHVGLVLWTSNTDYLELQVYSTGATTGTNSVVVALNNSGTIGTSASLNASTTTGVFGDVWLGFTNTGGSWQAQYSTDGTTWNNVGSAASHTASFTRVGLNAFTKIANPVSTYAGAFEFFKYNLANPTYNQTSFEFFDNANSTTPGTAQGINTNYTLTTSSNFRLRQLLKPNGVVGTIAASASTVIDSSANSNESSVAVASDGFARIAYHLNGSNGLVFVQCLNLSCSSKNSNTLDTSSASIGWYPELSLGSDGFARIVYWDSTNSSWKFIQCTNASCSTKNTTTIDTVASATAGGAGVAMNASDGFPRLVIGYATTGNSVKFIQCTNDSCSTNTKTTVVSSGNGGGAKLAVGTDGFARIIYNSSTNGLVFILCSNSSCSSNSAVTVDSQGYTLDDNNQILLDNSDFARILYIHSNAGDTLRFVRCQNPACSFNSPSDVVSNPVPGAADFAFSPDGNFIHIAVVISGTNELDYITCSIITCTNSGTSVVGTFGSPNTLSLALTSNDSYMITTNDSSSKVNLIRYSPPFKLRYGVMGSSCSTATYSDVTNSSAIRFLDNSSASDGASITYQSGTDPTDSGQTVVAQNYLESIGFTVSNSFGPSSDGEWDFALTEGLSSLAATSYCLKVTNYDDTDLASYTNYPVITTRAPTLSQLMRGGQYFSGNAKQKFFWAQ